MRALSSLLLAGAVGLGGLLAMPATAEADGGWRGRHHYRHHPLTTATPRRAARLRPRIRLRAPARYYRPPPRGSTATRRRRSAVPSAAAGLLRAAAGLLRRRAALLRHPAGTGRRPLHPVTVAPPAPGSLNRASAAGAARPRDWPRGTRRAAGALAGARPSASPSACAPSSSCAGRARPGPCSSAPTATRRLDRAWDPPAAWWPDRPGVVGGRDRDAGGTWMAANDAGVVAAVLNRPGSLGRAPGKRSRGELPLLALEHGTAEAAAAAIAALPAAEWRPFNMVVADRGARLLPPRHRRRPAGGAALPEGVSMVTALDPNDLSSPRTARHLPRFRAAPPPDPDRGRMGRLGGAARRRRLPAAVGPGGSALRAAHRRLRHGVLQPARPPPGRPRASGASPTVPPAASRSRPCPRSPRPSASAPVDADQADPDPP